MKISILLNEKNQIDSYALIGSIENGIELEVEEFDEKNYLSYIYKDGKLIFSEELKEVNKKNQELESLRLQRENEVFPIINRGKAWYDSLSEEQAMELNAWYQDWLNVTETLAPPSKPSWLK